MQLPSEVIQPSFYLFLFEEMVSIVQPVSTQLDCENDVRQDSFAVLPRSH